jgi:hypothetical protein
MKRCVLIVGGDDFDKELANMLAEEFVQVSHLCLLYGDVLCSLH